MNWVGAAVAGPYSEEFVGPLGSFFEGALGSKEGCNFSSICLPVHSALLFLLDFPVEVSIADAGHAGGPWRICLGVGFAYCRGYWRPRGRVLILSFEMGLLFGEICFFLRYTWEVVFRDANG